MVLQGESPLEGWKDIAKYVGRSERTVQRWERKGLPVHRHGALGVIAYRSELDVWVKSLAKVEPPLPQTMLPNPSIAYGFRTPEIADPSPTSEATLKLTQENNQPDRPPAPVALLSSRLLRRYISSASGIAVSVLLIGAILAPAYGLAIFSFCLGAVYVILKYKHTGDGPTARAIVSFYMVFAMGYIASASTMPEFHQDVINADTLTPAAGFLTVIGLKFIPLFILVLFYWVLFAYYGNAGFLRKPVWQRVYMLLGVLFLAADVIFLHVASGDVQVWRARLPGRWVLLTGSLVVLAANLAVWLAGRHCFRKESIPSYGPLFSFCAIAYFLIAVASFFIDHEHNILNRYFLSLRWPEAYVSRNPGAIANLPGLGITTKSEIGPDLANLLNDPELNEALRCAKFYRQHSDEPFQVFHRSVMFGYKRPGQPGEGPGRFVTIRFPKELADMLRFEPMAEEK